MVALHTDFKFYFNSFINFKVFRFLQRYVLQYLSIKCSKLIHNDAQVKRQSLLNNIKILT